jgi:hypothetical protein
MKYSQTLLIAVETGNRKGGPYKYKELTVHPQAKGHIQNVTNCIVALQVVDT